MAIRTLRAHVWQPSRIKAERLLWLHDNWGNTGYKMHDNMAQRYPTKRILNQWGCLGLQENLTSSIARWWVRIPITKGELRNYPLRMAPEHEKLLADPDMKVCNSELIRKGADLYIHLAIKKPVKQAFAPRDRVLAVDLGERNVATSVIVDDSLVREPRFHARAVRGLRRHYCWLRRRLSELGHFRTLARIRRTERRKVDDLLHKAARTIVDRAIQEQAAIAVGDLKGLRDRTPKGRGPRGKRFTRRIHNMPYGRLTRFIQYKAAWAGVPVLLVDERYTSKRCHRCTSDGTRPCQGLFRCLSCGWEGNADLNGAANIGKRALEYISEAGAPGSEPKGGQPDFTRGRLILLE